MEGNSNSSIQQQPKQRPLQLVNKENTGNMTEATTFVNNNNNNNMPESTEDCIEWDESKNLDLRKIASPHFQTPGTRTPSVAGTTAASSSTSSGTNFHNNNSSNPTTRTVKPRRSSLGGISRCLVNNHHDNSNNNNNNSSLASADRPATAHGNRHRAPEEEIDGILGRLQSEDCFHGSDSQKSTAVTTTEPTPRQKNTLRPTGADAEPTAAPHHSALPFAAAAAETVLPAKSRKRRRREQALQMARRLQNATAEPQVMNESCDNPSSSSTSITASQAAISGTPRHTNSTSGSGDFQDLLQQVQTPSPDMPPPLLADRGPFASNNSAPPIRTHTTVPPQEPITNMYKNKSSQPVVNAYKQLSSSQPNRSVRSNVQPKPVDQITVAAPPRTSTIPEKPVADITVDEFGDVDFSLDDLAMMDSLVMAATQTGGGDCTDATALTKDTVPAKPRHCSSLAGQKTVAPTIHAALVAPLQPCNRTNAIVPVKEKEEDPFGDFPDIDFSLLDKVIAPVAPTRAPAAPAPLQTKASSKTATISTAPAIDDDDPFGDFPDIDFGELDKTIAQRAAAPSANQGSGALARDLERIAQQQSAARVPPVFEPVRNPRVAVDPTSELLYLSFSRYKVVQVDVDTSTYTQTLAVAAWQSSMLHEDDPKAIHRSDALGRIHLKGRTAWPVAGSLFLRGEWYHTRLAEGDIIHVCSLKGAFRTDSSALPLMLHTSPPQGSDTDDLVLIVHPDMLLTPTGISETVSCTRRAILKQRLGSTGLTSEAPLYGTMRHELFEETMREGDFSIESTKKFLDTIVRRNAEGLLACGVSSAEAKREVIKFLPQLQKFAKDFTDFGSQTGRKSVDQLATLEGHGAPSAVRFVANAVDAIEEPVISPELGLKGNVDIVVKATTLNSAVHAARPSTSIMSVELKTGHNQRTQNAHMAQLALYMLMLQARNGSEVHPDNRAFGASESAILLYMNSESLRAVHVAPLMNEIKSLIGQRNVVASEASRASRPRGVVLSYESEMDSSDRILKVILLKPPPAALPDLLSSSHPCTNCYTNRECLMYAGAARASLVDGDPDVIGKSHEELLQQITGHLSADDFAYFQKWDRLVDFEADIGVSSAAESWLIQSEEREKATSKCISGLSFDAGSSGQENERESSRLVLISFHRAIGNTSLMSLGLEKGCQAIVSTDSTTFGTNSVPNRTKPLRSQMHIVRGILERTTDTHIFIRASRDDLSRIKKAVLKAKGADVLFRVDRDEYAAGTGTLRQNLVNLFTKESLAHPKRLPWLREAIIRLCVPTYDGSLTKKLFVPGLGIHGGIPSVLGCDLNALRLEFQQLNSDQQTAVEKVVTAKDYSMIQGLPGTGKTSTIAFVARLLVAHGKRVLITSYTHAAVDNVLLKLLENGLYDQNASLQPVIRVGRSSSCHPGVHKILTSRIALDFEPPDVSVRDNTDRAAASSDAMPSVDGLRQTLSSARIIGVTALSVPRSPLLIGQHFDVVIVDEAGQISQPAIIGALMAADSFVLVGDHMQLPPIVRSELAEKGGSGVSMLKRLAEAHESSVAQLTFQYRMHEDICQLSNDIIYKGKLKCGNDAVRRRRLQLSGFPENIPSINQGGPTNSSWLHRVVDPDSPVIFVNTDKIGSAGTSDAIEQSIKPLERSSGGGTRGCTVNDTEAGLVRDIVGGLVACGLDASSIGVICPFRAQLHILGDCASLSKWRDDGLEISTIDRYQGRDKPVIIVSFVRSNVKGRVGRLLEDFRRLNVVITRAKCKLIMVGSYSTLYRGSEVLKPVLDRVRNDNRVVDLPKEAAPF